MRRKTFPFWSVYFISPSRRTLDTRVGKIARPFDRTHSSSPRRDEQSTSLYTIADARDVRGRAPLHPSLSLYLYHLVASSHTAFVTTSRNVTTERSETRCGRTTQPVEDAGVATLTLLTGLLFAVFAFRLPSSQRRGLQLRFLAAFRAEQSTVKARRANEPVASLGKAFVWKASFSKSYLLERG